MLLIWLYTTLSLYLELRWPNFFVSQPDTDYPNVILDPLYFLSSNLCMHPIRVPPFITVQQPALTAHHTTALSSSSPSSSSSSSHSYTSRECVMMCAVLTELHVIADLARIIVDYANSSTTTPQRTMHAHVPSPYAHIALTSVFVHSHHSLAQAGCGDVHSRSRACVCARVVCASRVQQLHQI